MNYRVWSARAAVGFAPVVVAQVVARNWDGWEWWPFWADDIAAAVLLALGGFLTLENDSTINSRVLTGAWFFTVATLWVSMFRMFFNSTADTAAPGWLGALMLLSLLGSAVGAFGSLPSKHSASKPRRRGKPES